MTPEQRHAFVQAFTYSFQGNQQAVKLCLDILDVLHLWDDLIDRDKIRRDEDINEAFRKLFYDIPTNPVYQSVQNDIAPLMLGVILRWQDANEMERPGASAEDLHKAYMLRAGIYDLFVYLAWVIGGSDWAAEVGPMIRRLYGETLDDYMKEVRDA